MAAADRDILQAQRIEILSRGIRVASRDQTPRGFRRRDAMFQAMADVNLGWVSRRTEIVIRMAEVLALAPERAA